MIRRTLAAVLALLSCLSPAFAERGTVTQRRVTVHTYPAATAPVMATVGEGTRFEVESREGEWLRVRPAGEPPGSPRTGYVHSSALRLEPGAPPARSAAPAPVAAAPPSPAPAAAEGGSGGGFPTRLVLLGALAAGAGTAVYLATRPTDPETIDDDGDGFTEKQGDCNDRDQDIKPGGGFDFRIEFAYANGAIVACSTRNTAQQNYRVTNNGCDTLVVNNLSFTQTVAAPCTGSGGTTLPLSANMVAPGETVTVRQGPPPGAVAPICCPSYPCSQAPCVFNIQYTINTSAGSQTLSNSYTVVDTTGRDCPLCGSIGTDEVLRGAPRACTLPGGY